MKILTAAQMQKIDRLTTERYGVPSLTLMENAGRGVVEFLAKRFAPLEGHRIVILCGRGNNGGDGFVVARLLRGQGFKPRVLLFADPRNVQGDAAVNLERLAVSGMPEVIESPEAWQSIEASLEGTTLVVDALLGTGLTKPLGGMLLEVVRDVNRELAAAQVVAVDLPSGISADSGALIGEHVRADFSVTFTAPKIAHVFPPACERVGEWVVRQIGTPPEALESDSELFLNLACGEDFAWLARPRKPDANKGNFGHVLILAGSVGKTGAAALAAMAALRAGAGLVTVATAESALPTVASLGMEFMTEPLPQTEAGTVSLHALDYGRLDKLLEGKSVLAIGPGIGNVPETAELVRTLVNRRRLPVVLDADGLNAFAGCMDKFQSGGDLADAVLTPHPGEMSRLARLGIAQIQAHRVERAREFARKHQVTLVLKGYRTLTAAPDGKVWVNPTGNPGMATGGTGDVLTGMLAGLVAQYRERPISEVAAAAVYLHGLAGDLAAEEIGQAPLIAGDLIGALPHAYKYLRGIEKHL
ncbi:MAG TPA: NAD(P)H-hydrate dehydratase [Terriglobia bacterium]|nr:NAD(P)H-hydrate dehydratase [Terriglobia bacterium]